jgi:hypothetical protein
MIRRMNSHETIHHHNHHHHHNNNNKTDIKSLGRRGTLSLFVLCQPTKTCRTKTLKLPKHERLLTEVQHMCSATVIETGDTRHLSR